MAHSAAGELLEQVSGNQQDAHQKFRNALSVFEQSVFELERKCQQGNLSYHEIADAARKLHNKLQTLGNQHFAQTRNVNERAEFLTTCLGVVEEYRGELEQHQEWKIILSNLVKKLVNALMGLVYTNNFFPITRTTIALKADLFKNTIQTELSSCDDDIIDEEIDDPEIIIGPIG